MTSWLQWALLGVIGLVSTSAGCSRANVYAITGEATQDAASVPDAASIPDVASDPKPGAESVICPSPALAAGNTTQTLQVGTVSRSYVLHVPATYDGTRQVPLVLDFHGMGSSAANESTTSPYPEVTDPDGAIMAFPDGTVRGALGGTWNMGPCCIADVDDLGFVKALVEHLKQVACIDPARIYAVGVLTGGGMVYHLACNAADVFAAVAPAAFDLLQENVDQCRPSRPLTVISFRGTADTRVSYTGGSSSLVPNMSITFLGAKETFKRWAQIDGCTGDPSQEDSNGCSTYASCDDGVEVTLCTKQGGREEPGDARVAWPVLKRFALPTR